jgi:hypothetical protein
MSENKPAYDCAEKRMATAKCKGNVRTFNSIFPQRLLEPPMGARGCVGVYVQHLPKKNTLYVAVAKNDREAEKNAAKLNSCANTTGDDVPPKDEARCFDKQPNTDQFYALSNRFTVGSGLAVSDLLT